MDQEIDDSYKVEHGDNFDLTKEQFRKLIEAKIKRNENFARLNSKRESWQKSAN
jgi:parvulin-like peptidyl-prolyl isomerase